LNYKAYKDDAFGTSVKTWRRFLHRPHLTSLPSLFGVDCWDTILVDSPVGYMPDQVGRGVPIYTARHDVEQCLRAGKYADKQTVSVFVHDCNRDLEDTVSLTLLGTPIEQVGPKKLRHFVLKADVTSNAMLPPGVPLQLSYRLTSSIGEERMFTIFILSVIVAIISGGRLIVKKLIRIMYVHKKEKASDDIVDREIDAEDMGGIEKILNYAWTTRSDGVVG